jgi:pimeloyl-ACP methyl ester carboxylesterase
MFEDLVAALSDSYHIINLDQHGHGQSGSRGPLTLEEMAEDFAALIDAMGLGAVHWAGLSMGGMVGLRLALAHPERIKSLILMDTSSRPEMAERMENYLYLAEMIRSGRAEAVADAVLRFFFAPSTFKERPDLIAQYRAKLTSERANEAIYQAAMAVFNRSDITEELAHISAPALVIVGQDDIATPPDRSELLAERLPNARLVKIPDAGHMSATERPDLVAEAIRDFLRSIEAQSANHF